MTHGAATLGNASWCVLPTGVAFKLGSVEKIFFVSYFEFRPSLELQIYFVG